ncbi:MAG: hypothetical protein ACYDG6_05505 [Thermincolia bacterium]
MCVEKDLFLNRRTRQSGYIIGDLGESLSSTQKRDLVQVIYWIRCKYKFDAEDVADFLGLPLSLVKVCLEDANPICQTCKKKMKKPMFMVAGLR